MAPSDSEDTKRVDQRISDFKRCVTHCIHVRLVIRRAMLLMQQHRNPYSLVVYDEALFNAIALKVPAALESPSQCFQ